MPNKKTVKKAVKRKQSTQKTKLEHLGQVKRLSQDNVNLAKEVLDLQAAIVAKNERISKLEGWVDLTRKSGSIDFASAEELLAPHVIAPVPPAPAA